MELILGAVAAALAQIFTIPVSVIATRQQLGRSKKNKSKLSYPPQPYDPEKGLAAKEDKEEDDSFLAVGRKIVREDGIGGLWLGIKPGLVLTVNPAITYGVFERIKGAAVGDNSRKLSPLQAFFLGSFSKTLATIVCWNIFIDRHY